MKKYSVSCYILPVALLSLMLFGVSCDVYHFETPQPVDAENITEFPKIFQGTWVEREDDATEYLVIGNKYIRYEEYHEKEIVNSLYTDTSIYHFNYLRQVKYNKIKQPVDTVENYIIRSDKIYSFVKSQYTRDTNKKACDLSLGNHFTLKNDTIHFREENFQEIELGRNAFLRKLNSKQYILNIRDQYLFGTINGSEGFGYWWQIFLLEKTEEGKLRLLYPNGTIKQGELYGDYYVNQWTKVEMLDLIKKGFFEDKSNKGGIRIKTKHK